MSRLTKVFDSSKNPFRILTEFMCAKLKKTYSPVIATVANMTITPVLAGSTNATINIETPVIELAKMSVFFLPQYFKRRMQIKVPKEIGLVPKY